MRGNNDVQSMEQKFISLVFIANDPRQIYSKYLQKDWTYICRSLNTGKHDANARGLSESDKREKEKKGEGKIKN